MANPNARTRTAKAVSKKNSLGISPVSVAPILPARPLPTTTAGGGGIVFGPITPNFPVGGPPGIGSGPPVGAGGPGGGLGGLPQAAFNLLPGWAQAIVQTLGAAFLCNNYPQICAQLGINVGQPPPAGGGSLPGIGGSIPLTGGSGSCPSGFQRNPTTGVCEQTGIGGGIARGIPGGSTGTLGGGGQPVIGAFGQAAVTPAQVGTVTRNSGVVNPLLRCPRGMVLGKDSLCYAKGVISVKDRKWRPARRPPISAKDWKALQTSNRVKTTAKKIAGAAGFSCRRR